jgi:hypothetical protein
MAQIEIEMDQIVRLFNDVNAQPIGLDTENIARLNKSANLADLTDDWIAQWGDFIEIKKNKVMKNLGDVSKRANASAWVGADYGKIKVKKAHTEGVPIEELNDI